MADVKEGLFNRRIKGGEGGTEIRRVQGNGNAVQRNHWGKEKAWRKTRKLKKKGEGSTKGQAPAITK